MVALPTYGRSFTLKDPAVNGFGAPATAGKPGITEHYAPGTLTYYEICQMIKKGATVTRYKDQGNLAVAIKGDQWVGYDDVKKTMKAMVRSCLLS